VISDQYLKYALKIAQDPKQNEDQGVLSGTVALFFY
jgi:hypothetical protein